MLGFLWVQIRGVVIGKLCRELLKLRDGNLTLDEGTSVFEGGGEEHGDRGVEKGNTPSDFAGERVEVRGGGTAFPTGM